MTDDTALLAWAWLICFVVSFYMPPLCDGHKVVRWIENELAWQSIHDRRAVAEYRVCYNQHRT